MCLFGVEMEMERLGEMERVGEIGLLGKGEVWRVGGGHGF